MPVHIRRVEQHKPSSALNPSVAAQPPNNSVHHSEIIFEPSWQFQLELYEYHRAILQEINQARLSVLQARWSTLALLHELQCNSSFRLCETARDWLPRDWTKIFSQSKPISSPLHQLHSYVYYSYPHFVRSRSHFFRLMTDSIRQAGNSPKFLRFVSSSFTSSLFSFETTDLHQHFLRFVVTASAQSLFCFHTHIY